MPWAWEGSREEANAAHTESDSMGGEAYSVHDAVMLAHERVASLGRLRVTGEVTKFSGPNQRSGHCYFEVKDAESSMSVIIWKWAYQRTGIAIEDGMVLDMVGTFKVYERRGSLSFNVESFDIGGEGRLRQIVEQRKRRLRAEGLIDRPRRAIPPFCTRVCVVTSLSGSVIEDVRRTLERRNRFVRMDVVGCPVQGDDAPPIIRRALAYAASTGPDAILLVRGGGSYEDLMAFNDEALARDVARCTVPVITGIGHEPDESICDLVSDRRCSTPTAAAESVAPSFDELERVTDERASRLRQVTSVMLDPRRRDVETLSARQAMAMRGAIGRFDSQLRALSGRQCLQDPMAPLELQAANVEQSAQRLHDAMPRLMGGWHASLEGQATRLNVVGRRLAPGHRRETEVLEQRLGGAARRMLVPFARRVDREEAALGALSPLAVVRRGYAIVRDGEGHVVADASKLGAGDRIDVTLGAGSLRARVEEIGE